jgi:hypothetical protein
MRHLAATAFFFTFAFSLALPAAASRSLSDASLYARCYAHLTGHRVPVADSRLAQVRSGAIKGAAACGALLDDVSLDDRGMLAATDTTTGTLVLNHLYEAYRSWFAIQRFEDAVPQSEFMSADYDAYDSTTSGLFYTFAALGSGSSFSSIVTQPNGVYAVRNIGALGDAPVYAATTPYTRIWVAAVPTPFTVLYQYGMLSATKPTWDPNVSPITVGELVGVTPFGIAPDGTPAAGDAPPPAVLPDSIVQPFDVQGITYIGSDAVNEPGLAASFDIRSSLAPAGLIGTREYLMLNVGHDYDFVSDGALKTFRRWGKNVLSDLLCRDVPALRASDVKDFVVASGDPAVPPFRQATSCLRCHASMDQMAYTVRNLRWVGAAEAPPSDPIHEGWDTAHLTAYAPTTDAPFDWSATPVPDFHHQQPRGRLYYRSFDGTLVDRSVSDLGDLGTALAATDDLYVCAAKRHFALLTGIDVSLYDMGDEANAPLNLVMTAKDREYRDFVIGLGKQLKASGSVKELIKAVIGSSYYALSDYGKVEASNAK